MKPVEMQVDPIQLLLAGFDENESHDSRARIRRAFAPRRTGQRRKVTMPDVSIEDLNYPLFDSSCFVFDATYEVVPTSEVTLGPTDEISPAEEAEVVEDLVPHVPGWFNDNLECFTKAHAAVLWRELERLLWTKDANGATRKEILQWIFATYDYVHSKTNQVKSIRGLDWPFSFELCCYVEEIDPEALREAIAVRLHTIKQGAGHRIRASLH